MAGKQHPDEHDEQPTADAAPGPAAPPELEKQDDKTSAAARGKSKAELETENRRLREELEAENTALAAQLGQAREAATELAVKATPHGRQQLVDPRGGRGWVPLPQVDLDPGEYEVIGAAHCWVVPAYDAQGTPSWSHMRGFHGQVISGLPVDSVARGLQTGVLARPETVAQVAAEVARRQSGIATDEELDAMSTAELAAYGTQHPEEGARIGAREFDGAKGEVARALSVERVAERPSPLGGEATYR